MVKQTWVSPRGSRWAVKQAGNSRASRIFDTKAEACEYARNSAHTRGSELIEQMKNGRINRKTSYGNDPFPPRG